jgi:hypothetical protein
MVFAARSDEPISVGVYPHRSRTQSVALKKIKANGADTHTHAHRPVVEKESARQTSFELTAGTPQRPASRPLSVWRADLPKNGVVDDEIA